MYADDTTLYCFIHKLATNNIVINEHLDKVNVWMNSNKLVLNSKKTEYMLFHKHNKTLPNLNLSINGLTIDQVTRFNFFGFHLNSQLTWHTHIKEISIKISRVLGLIYEMQNILPLKILLSLYNTLILPLIIVFCLGAKKMMLFFYYKNVPFVLLLELDTDLTLSFIYILQFIES